MPKQYIGLYNHIVPPSHIVNSNYYLFKKGIRPAWEDPFVTTLSQIILSNAFLFLLKDKMQKEGNGQYSYRKTSRRIALTSGGSTQYVLVPAPTLFSFALLKTASLSAQVLAAIGETLETPFSTPGAPLSPSAPHLDQVTGIIVSSRKAFYRINIWTRLADTREHVEDIGKHFKYDVLSFPAGSKGTGQDKLASDVEFTSHEASQSKHKSKGWTV